jgi:UDP-N-acetylglucosamine--N-acetylmuramyl-(pentapeptide) pyrophosphoryl-undecaprenol N-acetylglucosamine transferase
MFTGNPIRKNLLGLPLPSVRYAPLLANRHSLKILVLGGSQGASILNACVPDALRLLPFVPEVWHQTGKAQIEKTQENYQVAHIPAKIESFIEDMAAAYAWADVVICRAGALTVAEIAAVGVASILIPFPYAVDDHQTANAKYLSEQNAAILLPQSQLTAERLSQYLQDFKAHPEKCLRMAEKCLQLAKPLATAQVAQNCLEVSGGAA